LKQHVIAIIHFNNYSNVNRLTGLFNVTVQHRHETSDRNVTFKLNTKLMTHYNNNNNNNNNK